MAVIQLKNQDYLNVEHIVIDGGSRDATLSILESNLKNGSILVSEEDRGLYDALNKGVNLATGDVIGMLHSDDVYADDSVLSTIANQFNAQHIEAVFGDVVFFKNQSSTKIGRVYSSRFFKKERMASGFFPAHTSLFVRKDIFKSHGLYRTDFKIAADIEFMIRLFKSGGVAYKYINKVLVKMRPGGISNRGIRSFFQLNREVVEALKLHGIKTTFFKILMKYRYKICELRW